MTEGCKSHDILSKEKTILGSSEIENDKFIDEITCKRCFQRFDTLRLPIVLRCFHIICKQCVLADKEKSQCPICKKSYKELDIKNLKTHSFIQLLADVVDCYERQQKGCIKCIGCSNVSLSRCLTCNENYCQQHSGEVLYML